MGWNSEQLVQAPSAALYVPSSSVLITADIISLILTDVAQHITVKYVIMCASRTSAVYVHYVGTAPSSQTVGPKFESELSWNINGVSWYIASLAYVPILFFFFL